VGGIVTDHNGQIPSLRDIKPRAQNRIIGFSEGAPMSATVAKPHPIYRLSRAELRRRWEQLDGDPLIAAIPCKVELNEVLSPTNTHPEMAEKTAAYLAAGAREVWLVGEDGVPEIHTSTGRASVSALGFELPHPPR